MNGENLEHSVNQGGIFNWNEILREIQENTERQSDNQAQKIRDKSPDSIWYERPPERPRRDEPQWWIDFVDNMNA